MRDLEQWGQDARAIWQCVMGTPNNARAWMNRGIGPGAGITPVSPETASDDENGRRFEETLDEQFDAAEKATHK